MVLLFDSVALVVYGVFKISIWGHHHVIIQIDLLNNNKVVPI